MKALGYVRVSTTEQAETGASLDAQRARIRAYCAAKNWELVEIIADEGWSGGDPDRPGVRRAMDTLLASKVGALVVVKLDRFTRRLADSEALRALDAAGVSFVSIEESFDTSTATGRAMLNMVLLFAQWEREVIGERTKSTLAHLKATGKRYSNVTPYGYRCDGGRLVPDAVEQAVLSAIREWRAEGVSLREIARALAAGGRKARNGRPFAPSTIAKLLAR